MIDGTGTGACRVPTERDLMGKAMENAENSQENLATRNGCQMQRANRLFVALGSSAQDAARKDPDSDDKPCP